MATSNFESYVITKLIVRHPPNNILFIITKKALTFGEHMIDNNYYVRYYIKALHFINTLKYYNCLSFCNFKMNHNMHCIYLIDVQDNLRIKFLLQKETIPRGHSFRYRTKENLIKKYSRYSFAHSREFHNLDNKKYLYMILKLIIKSY